MPGYIEVEATHPTTAELTAVHPNVLVTIEGKGTRHPSNMTCIGLNQTTGITPSTAILRGASGTDVTAPKTLTLNPHSIRLGTRVRIMNGEVCMFLGQIMTRMDQGQTDDVRWTAYDDRFFLSKIPIRGCFVRDPGTVGSGRIKFLPRYINRVNPNGRWNCVGTKIDGILYPVFSQQAIVGKSYQTEEEAFSEALVPGKIGPWTPRRYLMYPQLIAMLQVDDGGTPQTSRIIGVRLDHWRSLYNSNNKQRLKWDLGTVLGLKGVDPASSNIDPLDKKMPDMTFQGQMLGSGINKTLQMAGTHVLRLDRTQLEGDAGSPSEIRSSHIAFSPVGYSGAGAANKNIIVAQSGAMSDSITTAYDFQLHEDAMLTTSGVLVEGDTPILETSLVYENNAGTDTLKPAWTAEEEALFKAMIKGGAALKAMIPQYQGDMTIANLVDADGTGSRPSINSLTKDAIRMARMILPTVFRAFYIDSGNLTTQLHGVGGVYADEYKYPILTGQAGADKSYRPILPTQEQFITANLSGTDEEASRLVAKYPVRIRVKASGGVYLESLYTSGLKVTADGLIWLDGIGENVEGKEECMYSSTLEETPDNVVLKSIKINAAMPMDHRIAGYKESGDTIMDSDYLNNAINGKPMMYVYSPGAYKEVHQMTSEPASTLQFREDDGTVAGGTTVAPLTRFLPPGSEVKHAEYAAERKLSKHQFIKKSSSWKFPGIRMNYHPGDWISGVSLRAAGVETNFFTLYAPIESISYDFLRQTTTIGGVVSQIE